MATSDIKKGPLYVDSTNNRVGVGTTTPNKTVTVATPQTANTVMEVLRLTGSGAYSSGGSNEAGAGVSFGQYSGTYPDWNLGQISGVRSGASWDGALTFSTNNGTGQSSTTERMRIDSSGNVNVGVPTADTSSNYISVTGGLAGSQLNAQMRFYGKSVSNTGATYETARISGGSTSPSYSLSGGLVFYTSENNGSNVLTLSERMRIDSSGNRTFYGNHFNKDGSWSADGQVIGGFGGVTTSGTLDWNDATNARSGNGFTLLLGSATNGPGGGDYYHSFSFEYTNKDGTGNMTQWAIGYSNQTVRYMRCRYLGTWTSWSAF